MAPQIFPNPFEFTNWNDVEFSLQENFIKFWMYNRKKKRYKFN